MRNVADLTFDSYFRSKNEPGQWICWHFHEKRARPTHYTIKSAPSLVESRPDGIGSTERDRKTDDLNFKANLDTASFALSNSSEGRFIRLTQTGQNHQGRDQFAINAFEVFGTLLEERKETSK
jgi:hypothetical protein